MQSPPTTPRNAPSEAAAVTHYENFPVASWLCPKALRAPIAAIYHFARTADDLADEGTAAPAERLQQLALYRRQLQQAASNSLANASSASSTVQSAQAAPWSHVFVPLAEAIAAHRLPVTLLHNLLDAFVQDVEKTRDREGYRDQAELLDYCRRSANPVGRLLLHLWGVGSPGALHQSDCICTALQLINFWQDPSVDLPRGRLYFAADLQARHGVDASDLWALRQTPAISRMLAECVADARQRMLQGAPLVRSVPGRAGWELRLVVQGGLRILERIEACGLRTLEVRPTLRRVDYLRMFWNALWM